MSIDSLLAAAKLPETAVSVCLRSDLQADWEKLDRELTSRQATSETLAPSDADMELARRIKELEAEMAESTVEVRFRALTRKPWLKLVADNAPRKDRPADQIMGFNTDTMFEALVRESMVSPELDGDQLDAFLDALTSKQFDALAEAAWNLNRKDTPDGPVFSQAASRLMPGSDEK
ncbi:hypothetical protein [Amycolatopsis orientalis]|uniref:hypothetical protein n=1 Tax=Amycolatopsis orientalis TaxID=31958 RepID=UPI0003A626A9|nr:hypothetical protein [Amycolatopsis orientalis]